LFATAPHTSTRRPPLLWLGVGRSQRPTSWPTGAAGGGWRADESYVFRPERWSTFETPTLLLLGADSPPSFGAATRAAATRAVKAALPHPTLAVLAGQQHAAMDTAPDCS
jgi:hypothetical protein